MKILVLADIDEFHWRHGSGQADLVISCGDVSDSLILEAAKAHNCTNIFAVKGNHDPASPFPEPIVDLHMTMKTFGGLTLYGFNGAWQYKPRGHFLYPQAKVRAYMVVVRNVDIFIAHNSPKGIHDKNDDIHTGFEAFTEYIAQFKPLLLIHGHQHVNQETVVNGTRVIGVYGYRMFERK